MEKSKDLAMLILAAGKSSRLGEPKQLLRYKGESLLKMALSKALEVSNNVFVVLGYEKEICEKEIKDLPVKILYNKDYDKGIGSSISFGITNTQGYKNTLIILCDQPFITIEHFNYLKNHIDNKTIIATQYEHSNFSTVPAIFPKKFYDELMKLKEDFGAKKILNKNQCINIKLKKEKSVDIDTIEDIKKYLK